ncbi:NIPSNAP family protein [Xanthobacter sp. KR7-225]|uniref:NIPSNAP family protein n=1 Tax=Xanthobacter sp. KR7-225 TaxID=3156613 RepID=UPI0032B41012
MQHKQIVDRRTFIGTVMGAPLLNGLGIVPATAEQASSPAPAGRENMIYQLRIYEIFEHNKAAFHARFRDHAVRIMKRHGFDIKIMWEARTGDRTEFVYLLEWPDEAALAERWASFMADREWSDIKERTAAEHGKLVGEIQSRVLHRTDYSPQLCSD